MREREKAIPALFAVRNKEGPFQRISVQNCCHLDRPDFQADLQSNLAVEAGCSYIGVIHEPGISISAKRQNARPGHCRGFFNAGGKASSQFSVPARPGALCNRAPSKAEVFMAFVACMLLSDEMLSWNERSCPSRLL